MEIVPLSQTIGAEVRGVDLGRPLDAATRQALEAAWQKHIVLLFRDQDLDQDAQIAFANQFGEVGSRARPVDRRPEGADYNASIMLVSNAKENGKYIGSLPDGEMWFHHDMCYDYATRETVDISDDISKYKHFVQPLSVTHPVTGRRALYVNPLMTARVENLPEPESRDLLAELFAFADNSEIVYEHVWRKGDLMMWDNWCSTHARTDFPASELRMLRRCTIKGQQLFE